MENQQNQDSTQIISLQKWSLIKSSSYYKNNYEDPTQKSSTTETRKVSETVTKKAYIYKKKETNQEKITGKYDFNIGSKSTRRDEQPTWIKIKL